MTEKIQAPLEINLSGVSSFSQLVEKINQELNARICQYAEMFSGKCISQQIKVSESILTIVFEDGTASVIEAAIENELPVMKFLTPSEIVSSPSLREKFLGNDLLARFMVVKKSEEEIEKARIKSLALAKLTPEEIAALGVAVE